MLEGKEFKTKKKAGNGYNVGTDKVFQHEAHRHLSLHHLSVFRKWVGLASC